MKARQLVAVVAATGLISLSCTGSSNPESGSAGHSLDEWMEIGGVSEFAWSPDGEWLYYLNRASDTGVDEVFRVPAGGGTGEQITSGMPDHPLQPDRPDPKSNLTLSPDGETLYFTAARYFSAYHNIYSVPAEGGDVERLTFNNAVIETDPRPSPDGETLAYFAHQSEGTQIHFLDLDGERRWPRTLDSDVPGERRPLWSPDGDRLLYQKDGVLWVHDVATGTSSELIERDYRGGNGSPVWSPDGSRVAIVRDRSGFNQVGVVDVATGAVTAVTMAPRIHGDVSWSPDGTTLVFTRKTEDALSSQVAVTAADGSGEVRELTSGPGMRGSPRFSPDGGVIAYIESTDTRTSDVWTIDPRGGEPSQVTNSMGAVDPADLSEAEEVFYPGPDSLPIPTLLYRPADFDPDREYPVIVRIHGHPGQWNHSFEMERQYFVQRGFVVVAPNPRGSGGFGQGFHDLHIGDYGGTEYDDVMSVLDYLGSLDYVDMSKKATWGGSGGGYMSFVIATRDPGVFQAQVIRAPVSSWKLLAIDRYAGSGRFWSATRPVRRERSEFGGSYDEVPEEYENRSPINFVENVETPQLLMQGLRDSPVPPRQSQVWAERMEELGKGDLLTYVEYAGEDHGLDRYRSNVRDRIERMETFLARHLGLR